MYTFILTIISNLFLQQYLNISELKDKITVKAHLVIFKEASNYKSNRKKGEWTDSTICIDKNCITLKESSKKSTHRLNMIHVKYVKYYECKCENIGMVSTAFGRRMHIIVLMGLRYEIIIIRTEQINVYKSVIGSLIKLLRQDVFESWEYLDPQTVDKQIKVILEHHLVL